MPFRKMDQSSNTSLIESQSVKVAQNQDSLLAFMKMRCKSFLYITYIRTKDLEDSLQETNRKDWGRNLIFAMSIKNSEHSSSSLMWILHKYQQYMVPYFKDTLLKQEDPNLK